MRRPQIVERHVMDSLSRIVRLVHLQASLDLRARRIACGRSRPSTSTPPMSTTHAGSLPLIRSDAGETTLDLLCGRFKVDSKTMDQLLETLPQLLHVSLSESTPEVDLRAIVEMMRSEVEADSPGATAIVEALSTVLLTLALRIHSRRDAVSPSLLRLRGDARMARAAQAIFADPGREAICSVRHERTLAGSRCIFRRSSWFN